MNAEAKSTSTELTLIERAQVALQSQENERKLKELAQASKSITAITNKAGYDQCHSSRMALKKMRVDIEKVGKTAREDAQAFSKAVIAEQNRLIGLIQPEEARLDAVQRVWDDEREREKQAKADAERKRVSAIRERIDEIRQRPADAVGQSSAEIELYITALVRLEIGADFAEFQQEAAGAKETALVRLRSAHAKAMALEEEQARLSAERAENERIRLENEEAARVQREQLAEAQRLAKEELERERLRQQAEADVERARIAEEERVAKVARDAEAARQAEILRLQREENDRIERERQEAHEVEARRIATERAEAERIEAERQVAREADERRLADERARLERDQEELRAAQALAAAPLPAPVAAVVDEPAAESDLVAPEPVTETAGDDDPESLTASIDLKELLMMQSVCQFAQVWAAFQERDSKLDQKTDRKLAQQAREAEANLLAVIEQLPAHYGP